LHAASEVVQSWHGASCVSQCGLLVALLLGGCSASRTSNEAAQAPAIKSPGSRAFFAARLRLDFPPEMKPWLPDDALKAELQERKIDPEWLALENSSLRFSVSREGPLREDSLEKLCASMEKRFAGSSTLLLENLMYTRGGMALCRVKTRNGDQMTVQHIGVLEGRTMMLVANFKMDEYVNVMPVIQSVLASLQYIPTQVGTKCSAHSEETCFDDRRIMTCEDGKRELLRCDVVCEDHGGTALGCLFADDRVTPICACNQP
jgi:hypothetical protein